MTIQDLINKKDYDYISYRVTHPKAPDGVFIGSCHSKNGEIVPNDYQDYLSPDREVLSYDEWNDLEKGIKSGLDILVEWEWA